MENLLNKDQQLFLLGLARRTIQHYLEKGEHLKTETKDQVLLEKRGAFVTLKKNDELRGCIGYPLPYKPLYETIIDVAVSSATQDFRFESLSLEELPEMKIEISVLTLPKPIKDVKEIELGKHGIIISKGASKGLLLPQVPVEWNWDLETYIGHGCLKAGLDEDEWKKGAKIEIFSAQVFSE
ncbi:MAG: AmmeMemoRadiSam system protein A [Candidatus Aminicenantes bacterium]|nr:MAG: AmmeMemoRadiSam system protein A [Candidatus Aminicenantes bacterium]